ncbi:MAG: hypothetical protein A2268_08690 [Candidatus Raymondbacteria bacterium RifOxyA12_full_50_37]|uniref:GIY-YIG domain-containing protein n=1 Tax=Candidatus Raymondbacteria bacterium RIFOXYD12_FULL_49_13 TaxID=1817890 RepID=A0A1F7FLI8_UNCRA|nr:MAG: hypothetical protein A2268_08690 [Candidatus Raymondbacteria bacterium RifOxyA12_full_50_37]OGJ93325.1 MAG: hypothetical protein A2248_07920 [Candidatus Raymondbacteria bacterium RIFOXYA2_FULL_49_16]OGJ95205.1 MAG: hypothetical protein A2453_12050 [Candidatus Raymondbacteria bacterium RIFOXYC2_FULL_50_21]OGK06913.1 MAG: hypothetical protein A2487_14475 [Candidatus Raymondbacteria bacterium RifOxyC12_full_50_8]OGK07508.1 MAG: hypothetical protein A2519_16745 [Candidatus Raymondbacteria b
MKPWFLYIIQCRDKSLYTGITTDVKRRFHEHGHVPKKAARFLRGKGPLQLVFKKKIGARSLALRTEYRVKQLSRTNKQRLIQRKIKIKDI